MSANHAQSFSGEFFWINLTVSPLWQPDEAPSQHIAIVEDITARKLAEQQLVESETRLRTIFEQEQACVKILNRFGELEEMNPAGLAMIGASSINEVRGGCVYPLVLETYRSSYKQLIASVFRGESGQLEFEMQGLDGQLRWMETHASPLTDAAGNVISLLGVTHDISEHKRSEEAIRRSEEQLRELNVTLEFRVAERTAELAQTNADLDAYAHTIAHDLRAPLRAMHGYAKALREDYIDRLDDTALEYTDMIESAAEQMDRLTQDLLDYSRVGQGDNPVQPVDVGLVVEKSIKLLQVEIAECSANIEVESELPFVMAHANTLTQAVTNLLSNAIKFVGNDVQPNVKIWTEHRGESVRLWVQDNGIGIDTSAEIDIFHVFKRLHGIESYPGTGIGLAIVRRAIESMGGTVGLESEEGHGSRFWIELAQVKN